MYNLFCVFLLLLPTLGVDITIYTYLHRCSALFSVMFTFSVLLERGSPVQKHNIYNFLSRSDKLVKISF